MHPKLTLLVKHQYDALNQLVTTTPSAQATSQRFYMKGHLVTEIQGTEQRSIMQHDDQLLAEQQHQGGTVKSTLLATDQQRSVLSTHEATSPARSFSYTPYGHRALGGGLLSLLGFNGERPDRVTGWYLLGIGHHRPFNPVLMCFTSPDSWSPFGEGWVNAYAYCKGDPVNQTDPTGHIGNPVKGMMNFLKLRSSPMVRAKRMARANQAYTRAQLDFPRMPKNSSPKENGFFTQAQHHELLGDNHVDFHIPRPTLLASQPDLQSPTAPKMATNLQNQQVSTLSDATNHTYTSSSLSSSPAAFGTSPSRPRASSSSWQQLSREDQLETYKAYMRSREEYFLSEFKKLSAYASTPQLENIVNSSIAHRIKMIRSLS